MTQRNDQIFQLSLTEIAFTIVFVLLLLLGYLVIKEQKDRIAAEAALSKVQSAEQATGALKEAENQLKSDLIKAGLQNPEQVISKLVESEAARAERDVLKKQVSDLDDKLTALTELQSLIEKTKDSEKAEVAKAEIESALALQVLVRKSTIDDYVQGKETNKTALDIVKSALATSAELKRQLKEKLAIALKPGEESDVIRDVVSAARSFEVLGKGGISPEVIKKENSDLRGQVAFLKNKLARGGLDYPPCWADENGKIQFLFSIELKPDSILVASSWPASRNSDANSLPGIAEVLAGSPLTHQKFVDKVQGIFAWSKAQNPECRHYVYLKSSIGDAILSDRTRLMVENYFYKAEARR